MKNRKRLVPLLLIFVLTLSGCTGNITGNTKTIQYKTDGDHAVVTALPNGSGDTVIQIGDTYEGLPVTAVKDFAGCNLESAETIQIGKNVSEIGCWSFTNNQRLKQLLVDEENEHFCTVDGVLFTKDMKTLVCYPPAGAKEYKIPDTVEVIRSKAFYKCGELERLTLPESLVTLEEKAFFRCGKLSDLSLPDGLTAIGKDAFGYCTSLKEITIPKSVKTIEEYAFFNCTALHKVNVNNSEKNLTLGKSWQPTNNGLAIGELVINWEGQATPK